MSAFLKLEKYREKIVLSTYDKVYIINTSDIIRCEAINNYTRFYLVNGEDILVSKTLSKYESILIPKGSFIRIHRSHIINIDHIKSFSKGENPVICMTNDQVIPYSQEKKKVVLNMLSLLEN